MADAARLRHVAEIITDTYKAGNQVVAVLSAQGDTTDELIEKANEINPLASNRAVSYTHLIERSNGKMLKFVMKRLTLQSFFRYV